MKSLLIMVAWCLLGLSCQSPKSEAVSKSALVDVTEVLYFHGKQRCITCNAIERLSQELVDSLGQADLVMRVIDINQNPELADRYQVTWSALVIERNGQSENLTEMAFRYAKSQPNEFKSRLQESIKNLER